MAIAQKQYYKIVFYLVFSKWIIIGSDRRPETKQGIEGKIDRFRSGRVTVRIRDRVRVSVRVRVRFRSPI